MSFPKQALIFTSSSCVKRRLVINVRLCCLDSETKCAFFFCCRDFHFHCCSCHGGRRRQGRGKVPTQIWDIERGCSVATIACDSDSMIISTSGAWSSRCIIFLSQTGTTISTFDPSTYQRTGNYSPRHSASSHEVDVQPSTRPPIPNLSSLPMAAFWHCLTGTLRQAPDMRGN